jgi:4-hydroxybenzoate polyprenyltransferase
MMIKHLVRAARPQQWIKNLLLYAGFLFTLGAGKPGTSFGRASLGFALFCCLSASAYILNDLIDADSDRKHPTKRNRPIASGALSPAVAAVAAGMLGTGGVAGAFAAGLQFGCLAVLYVVVTVGYSTLFKRVVLLDVIVLAIGYVVRAVAGAVIVGVPASFWLALCTMLLALFLGLCKRRAELASAEKDADIRKVLAEYSLPLLDQLISVVTSSALLAYALYTYSTPTKPGGSMKWLFIDHELTLTIPFVVYGIYRYLYLVYKRNLGASPEMMFLKDRPMQWNTVLWAAACAAALISGR